MCAENESIEMDSVQLVLGPSALGLAGLSNAEPKKGVSKELYSVWTQNLSPPHFESF